MPELSLQLPDNDWGQLLDGLGVLIEQWDATEDFLRTGNIDPDISIRQCHNTEEAKAIAAHYRSIRDNLNHQRSASRLRSKS